MRTLLASILLGSIVMLAAGCPLGCSGYTGAGDQVYARGTDQLILCTNGGYSAMVGSATLEGYFTENAPGSTYLYVGTDGPTATQSFELAVATDGTATSPQLGDGAWTEVSLDKTALDHADTICQGLETRTWWATSK